MSAEPTQQERLARLISDFQVRMTSTPTEERPLWAPDGYDGTAWRVTLRMDGRTLTTSYFMGPAHRGKPKVEDVLDCLIGDASSIDNARDFADWCAEFGFDTDSRRAEASYRATAANTMQLKTLLGPHYDRFLAAERL